MTMYVAMNGQQQLVTVQEVERGLACGCTCIECGEALIARKGEQKEHHFAHCSNKESCEVRRESLLHLFAKQVIREAMGLQMPHLPGQPPEFGEPSSWWDFELVEEEVWLDGYRPDLFVHLRDGRKLLIEIAVTSFVDEVKLERIRESDLWALEVDLSDLHDAEIVIPSDTVRQVILHRAECKYWVYPEPVRPEVVCAAEFLEFPPPFEPAFRPPMSEHRFTIDGMWVSARELPSGSLAVRSISYSPQMRDLLKRLAREMGGYYKPAYRNWVFPPVVAAMLLSRLAQMAE